MRRCVGPTYSFRCNRLPYSGGKNRGTPIALKGQSKQFTATTSGPIEASG